MCARSAPRTRATPWPPSLTTATSSTSTRPASASSAPSPAATPTPTTALPWLPPHIAGLGAYLLGTGAATAAGMCEYIAGLALEGVLGGVPSGTANLLAQNGEA